MKKYITTGGICDLVDISHRKLTYMHETDLYQPVKLKTTEMGQRIRLYDLMDAIVLQLFPLLKEYITLKQLRDKRILPQIREALERHPSTMKVLRVIYIQRIGVFIGDNTMVAIKDPKLVAVGLRKEPVWVEIPTEGLYDAALRYFQEDDEDEDE